MKNYLKFTLFVLCLSCLTSCSKEDGLGISYAANGMYGENILELPDSSIINPYQAYSLSADLEQNARFKLELINFSDPNASQLAIWSYDASKNNGWLISDYSFQNNMQRFENKSTGHLDLSIEFGGSGSCTLNFYENGSTLSLRKYLFW